jgi:hypothetical protein
VKALRDSGANDAQLERLLSDIGAKNPRSKNIGQALFDRGMQTEAKWVWGGGSGFLPFF